MSRIHFLSKYIRVLKVLLLSIIGGLWGCDDRSGMTVETSYVEPVIPPPTYKFSRHGSSSVDTRHCELVNRSLDVIYTSYLREARIQTRSIYHEVQNYLNLGYNQGYPLISGIATSQRHKPNQANIIQSIHNLVNESSQLGGFNQSDPSRHRNTPIRPNTSGYIGVSLGDKNIAFANAHGVVVAEVFKYSVMGAYYLDQLFNIHTDESIIKDESLRKHHQNHNLVVGQNYTALEHHWDLAFGYYQLWRSTIQSEGSPLLREREQKIYDAFAEARFNMSLYDYASLEKNRNIIYDELSKAVIIRAMYLLLGRNTQANLTEDAPYAFHTLSQAIGIIRCLPFLRSGESGEPYFTHEAIDTLLGELLADKGLWKTDRLLADEQTKGSLKHVASVIGKPIGININALYSN